MAGDGGRAPDVSEQRADDGGVEAAADALHRRLRADWSEASCERMAAQAVVAYLSRSDPASVLAALLAESPEATVAAIEALLTSAEAVVAVSALRRSRFDNAQPMAPWTVEVEAACRSLRPKAPKEDRDA